MEYRTQQEITAKQKVKLLEDGFRRKFKKGCDKCRAEIEAETRQEMVNEIGIHFGQFHVVSCKYNFDGKLSPFCSACKWVELEKKWGVKK